MDISMPLMDGIATTHAIVQEFLAAPILILSNDVDAEAESLQAGAAAFLPKSIAASQLLKTIRALVGRLPSPIHVA